MTEFQKGQQVKVEWEGTINRKSGTYLWIDTARDQRVVETFSSDIKITLLDPPDWPPQAGDIWGADGEEYYARECRLAQDAGIYLTSCKASARDYMPSELDGFKALNPVLVRRRCQ